MFVYPANIVIQSSYHHTSNIRDILENQILTVLVAIGNIKTTVQQNFAPRSVATPPPFFPVADLPPQVFWKVSLEGQGMSLPLA